MKKHLLLALCLLPSALMAQAPSSKQPAAAKPKFDLADVQVAPHRDIPNTIPGGLFSDRYIVRQATMLQLIVAAYGVEAGDVGGGPSWLELDRFDITARTTPRTPKQQLQLMLQSLLADRFHLVLQPDTKPMPAYLLSVGKGSKLKEAATPDAPAACKPQPMQPDPASTAPIYVTVDCSNMSMEVFAETLHRMARGYVDQPVVDQTGLKGTWDFQIKWSPQQLLQKQGPDGISISDAVDKQLGLKLELKTAPRPVLAVVSVDQKPTPNEANIAQLLPPPPPARFDVATIKPSAPDAKPGGGGFQGDRIDARAIPLKFLLQFAWNLSQMDENALTVPKWVDSAHVDIVAKVDHSSLAAGEPTGPQINIEDFREMLKALLIERYHIQSHTEDRSGDAYSLIAVSPKLRKADPASRTRCKEGPGPDGKDPRVTTPILNRLITCQNMTVAQIGDELQRVAAGYIHSAVLDKTGLPGTWDFTLSFSSINQNGLPGGGAAPQGEASEPTGALSVFDAVNRQLGLKLEKEKRALPTLVIDQMDEKPSDN